jgi:hypothetical protein
MNPFPPDTYDGWTEEELEKGPLNLLVDVIDGPRCGPFDPEAYYKEVAWEFVRIAKAMAKTFLRCWQNGNLTLKKSR